MNSFQKFTCFLFVTLAQMKSYAVPNQNKKIDDLAQNFMSQNKVPGMSIAVLNQDKTLLFNYGSANETEKIKVTSDTIYTIASFTKTFTASLSAVASVEGKLNLDDSISRNFSELKKSSAFQKITARELLGHVSSLPFDFDPSPKTYEEFIKDLNQWVPNRLPGTAYQYSNIGIGLMGYVLQKIYTQNYENLLKNKILNPLNMNSTYLNLPMEKEKYLTMGHDKNNTIVPYRKEVGLMFAAGALKSTIADMSKYLNAQMNPSTLKNTNLSKAISIVHENQYCFENKKDCEQLAWQAHIISELKNVTNGGDSLFINYDGNGNGNGNGNPLFAQNKKIIPYKSFSKNKIFIDKTGSGYGMSSYMAYIPDQKRGIVILLNKVIGDERIQLGRNILLLNK